MYYVCPSVRLFVCLSVAKSEKPFSQKLSNLVLWCLLTSYRKSYRVLPLGEFTVMISEPHATLQGLSPCEISVMIVPHCRCKNSIHHIENRFSSYFIFCFIFNAVWALTSGGFRIISDTLVRKGALKMTDMKLQDMKLTDRVAGHEIAGHENGGPNSRT